MMVENINGDTTTSTELINQFYKLADHLKQRDFIEDASKYKNDISAFLLHMSHLKSYYFAQSFCKEKRILDIGCNIGYGANVLGKVAKEVVAIDFDNKALDFARNNYAAPNIRFKQTEAKILPFESKCFDIVTSFQVIEHIRPADISRYLNEINRVLNKNGIALFTTPNRKLRLNPFEKPWNPEHYTEYTAKGYKKILTKYFNRIEILGLRSEKWIEDIERNRIQKSFFKSYVLRPGKHLLGLILPAAVLQSLKKIKPTVTLGPSKMCAGEDFNKLVKGFSMGSFNFESNSLDNSLYLLAICRNRSI